MFRLSRFTMCENTYLSTRSLEIDSFIFLNVLRGSEICVPTRKALSKYKLNIVLPTIRATFYAHILRVDLSKLLTRKRKKNNLREVRQTAYAALSVISLGFRQIIHSLAGTNIQQRTLPEYYEFVRVARAVWSCLHHPTEHNAHE